MFYGCDEALDKSAGEIECLLKSMKEIALAVFHWVLDQTAFGKAFLFCNF